jgi:predicted transcriptional regulator
MESIQDYGVHYRIKKKSLDLIWSDVIRDNILNLIQIDEYTFDEILRIVDDSNENIRTELSLLEQDKSPMIEYIMINEEKRFRLTSVGKQCLGNILHVNPDQPNNTIEK